MIIIYDTKAKKFNNDLRHYLSMETNGYEFYKDQKEGKSIVLIWNYDLGQEAETMIKEIKNFRIEKWNLKIVRSY